MNAKNAPIFVTGATGVLGRAVLRLAREKGLKVTALTRSEQSTAVIRDLGAEPIEVDLFDQDALTHALGGSSTVLHLATRIAPIDQWRRPAAWVENDHIRILGTQALVGAAFVAGVNRFIYPSVTLVYPDSGANWIDATCARPQPSIATDSTLVAEREVERFGLAGHTGITLRMGPFYGTASGQSRYLLSLARRGFTGFIARNAAYHPFIWIDDAAAAIIAALGDMPSGTFDVVDDEPLTVLEIRETLARAVKRHRVYRLPRWLLRYSMGSALAEVSCRSRRVSNAAFKAASGWSPSVPNARLGWPRLARELANEVARA
jgi:nucleoside-diphosphate-sugar epimerase